MTDLLTDDDIDLVIHIILTRERIGLLFKREHIRKELMSSPYGSEFFNILNIAYMNITEGGKIVQTFKSWLASGLL